MRTVKEVFDHHVKALNEGNLDEVAADYAEHAFVLTKDDGVVKGRPTIKKWFEGVLSGPLVGAHFDLTTEIVEGDIVYIEWKAEGTQNVATGTDTFVIHDDKIHVQTVKILSLGPK